MHIQICAESASHKSMKEVGLIPRKGSVREGQADVAILPEKVEASIMSENSTSNAPSLPMKPPPISSSGKSIIFPSVTSSRCDMVREKSLQNISSNSQRKPVNGPALEVIWKGNFGVDFSSHKRIFRGFLAHMSAKVSRKAYVFTRQIPEVMQFTAHPRCAYWPEIFQLDCPDANDIALYFYPGNFERSRRHYSFLLKLIEKENLVLRSRMGRVELLVFTSKLLHVESQQLDGNYFMWGFFRRLKGKEVANKAEACPR
ncbi:uncharacterized protein LOC130778505 isoform X2 [Actinidia eriantha]|uniref:uncharacterized protein LOC130778505 isoform X2 n=1 Tax=Actinidia eriantha TaxID=165200 RepID=UPI00258A7E01|nr:uncharacterized protein LOC130778505 isoform X2 [Actinidia eriantha]